MFTYNEESKLLYFSKTAFESSLQYELFGKVIGLAMYNQCLLALSFPLVVYKKLLSTDGKVRKLFFNSSSVAST